MSRNECESTVNANQRIKYRPFRYRYMGGDLRFATAPYAYR